MALDEAGLGQVSEWLSSIFQSNTIEADSGGDIEGYIEGGMPEGTTPDDVASCAPGAASSAGGAYQSNYAGSSYSGHATAATQSVAHEVAYVTNITNQSNVFIIGDNNQVQVGQGETVQQNQNAINVENPEYPDYDPEYEPPYGGGAGMVFKPEPVVEAIRAIRTEDALVIHPSPAAPRLTQQDIIELSHRSHLIFLASRYEGLDQRVIDHFVDREYTIGDFVISGGELACAVMIDAVVRLLPGAIGKESSYRQDSYFQGILDYPHYTRPADFEGLSVPEVLLSGNHEKIRLWREERAMARTRRFRPDLLEERDSGEK